MHDLTSLRLHPDGTRVQAGTSNYDHEENGPIQTRVKRAAIVYRSARERKKDFNVAEDRYGNKIAKDALGKAGVNQYGIRAKKPAAGAEDAGGDGEVFDLDAIPDVDDGDGDGGQEREVKTFKKRKRKDVKDPRSLKKRAFEEDFAFIASSPTSGYRASSVSVLSQSARDTKADSKASKPGVRIENGELIFEKLPSSVRSTFLSSFHLSLCSRETPFSTRLL